MKKLFLLFFAVFFMGQIAVSQWHTTTLAYTPDTDCSAVISEAGGSFAFGIDVDFESGGWTGNQQLTWLPNMFLNSYYEITNTATGDVTTILAASRNLTANDFTMNLSHNTLNGFLEDGEYTVRLITIVRRNSINPSGGVLFTIEDAPANNSASNFINQANESVTYVTDIIFCFEYQKCDDVNMSIQTIGNNLHAAIGTTSSDVSFVWVIQNLNGPPTIINDVTPIQMTSTCAKITLTVTDNETGCRYEDSVECFQAFNCETQAPTGVGMVSLPTGEIAFTWSLIPGAVEYKVVIVPNGSCCGLGELSTPREFFVSSNVWPVPNLGKANCFSIQIFPICANGAEGPGSEVECHFNIPFFSESELEVRSTFESNQLTVYPNPASDHVQIKYSGILGSSSNMTIFDSNGKVMMSRDLEIKSEENLLSWNVRNVPAGIYIIRSKNGNDVITKKLIVTK